MRRVYQTLVLLVVLAIGIFSTVTFLNTDYFKIEKVDIKGNIELLRQDIKSHLEDMKGKNIIYLDTNKIQDLIKSDARVSNISIKKIYPNKIEIQLDERQPYVYVKKGSDIFLADANLNLYGDISETPQKNIPVIIYSDSATMNGFKTIISKIKNKDLYALISEIRLADKSYQLILTDNTRVYVDTFVDEEKYNQMYRLYKKLKAQHTDFKTVELRYKDITTRQ